MSRIIGLFFSVFIVGNFSLAMTPNGSIGFDKRCAKVEHHTLEDINQGVTFSVVPTTQSQAWDIISVLHNNVFIKKRGILLSEALTDLTKAQSESAFECGFAQTICYWRVALSIHPEIDQIIDALEKSDQNFALPLVLLNYFSTLLDYAKYYGFPRREGSFMIGSKSCIIEDEWQKIQSIEHSLDRINAIFDISQPYKQREGYPCTTGEGGILYLPNVDGVKGAYKGENLFCVDAKEGMFYGFGPLFVDGPKTLRAIAENLEKNAGSTYTEQMGIPLEKGLLANMQEDQHPLFWLIKPDTCLSFNAQKIERAKEQLKLESHKRACDGCKLFFSKLSMCGRCEKVKYCSRACQKQCWPQHKIQCEQKDDHKK